MLAEIEQDTALPTDLPFDHQLVRRSRAEGPPDSGFNEVDFDQAREDVRPFVCDADALALWGREFFLGLVDQVKGG